MAWQEPVFDRTAADVAAGVDKCYFSPALLNRIEGNTQHLAQLFGVRIDTHHWVSTDFLTLAAMQRILHNLAKVRNAYFTLPESPAIPALPATRWDAINAVEQIQWDLYELWQRNQCCQVYAGEIYIGEAIGVI